MHPPVSANTKVSITAFRRAGSTRPLRKTAKKFWNASPFATLKTGSGAWRALSVLSFYCKLSPKPLNLVLEEILQITGRRVYLQLPSSLSNLEESTGSVSNGSSAKHNDLSILPPLLTNFPAQLLAFAAAAVVVVTRKLSPESC